MSTPQTPRTISPPVAKTAETVVSVPVPSAATNQAPIAIGVPSSIANQAVGAISTPTAKTSQAVGTIPTPTAKTSQAVGSISTPTAATAEVNTSIGLPTAYQSLGGLSINRALTPYFNFNSSLANFDGISYSRASNATYIETYSNARGLKAKRIKTDFNGSVTNSLTRSEQFDDVTWGTTTFLTVAKTGQKFNGSDVYLLKNDTADTFERLSQTVNNTGVHTLSFVVKANTQSVCFIRLEGTDLGQSGNDLLTYKVDLKNERIENVGAVDRATVNLEYLKDGFYRVSLTPDSASTIIRCYLYLSFDVATAGSLFVTQAQLSNTNVPAPYVKTLSTSASQTFTAQPRIEDDGLLVEVARTNAFLNSEDFLASSYSNQEVNIIGYDYGFGLKMAKIAATGVNAAHFTRQVSTALAGTEVVSFSCFFKKASSQRYARLNLREDTNNHRVEVAIDLHQTQFFNPSEIGSAVLISADIFDYGDYFRVTATVDFNVATTNHQMLLFLLESNDPNSTNYSGDGFSSLIAGGWQMEAGEVSTSYIKTLGATVSRANETIRADISLNHEFSVLVEGSYPSNDGAVSRRLLTLYDSGANNELIFYNAGSNNWDNAVVLQINGAFTPNLNSTIINNENTSTAILTRDNGVYNYYYQGELAEQLEEGLPFELSRIALGQSGGSSFFLNGYIKRIEIYNHAFTASEVKSQ